MKKTGKSNTKVLLLGSYRPTLIVIRALYRQGYEVILGVGGPQDRTYHAERSRYVSEVWEHPPWQRGSAYIADALDLFLQRRPDVQVVYPISHHAVCCINPQRERFEQVTLVLPSSRAVDVCADKRQTFALVRHLEIPIASYETACDLDGLLGAARKLQFPLVVKPFNSNTRLFEKKAIHFHSMDELQKMFPAWPEEHPSLLVQRRVEGPRHNLYFAARAGVILGAVQIAVRRTDRADGTGLAVEGHSVPLSSDVMEHTRKCVAELDYTGVGCAQFLMEEEGNKATFLELNPRLGANFAIVEHCGLPLALLALELAVDKNSTAKLPEYWSYPCGRRFAWTFGDLSGCRHQLRAGEITKTEALHWLLRSLRAALRANIHLTWSWRDPLPTLLQFAGAVRRVVFTRSR